MRKKLKSLARSVIGQSKKFTIPRPREIEEYRGELANWNGSRLPLVKHDDDIWLVKTASKAKAKRELLVYALAKGIVNAAEVRAISGEDFKELKSIIRFPKEATPHNSLLIRLAQSYSASELPQKTLDSAVAGELVFSLMIRRRDVDVWNRSYTKEGIPVFYDLSACLDFEEDLQDVRSFFAKKSYGYAGSWRVREWDNDELPNAAILRKASDHNIYVKNTDTFKQEVGITCSLLRQRLEQINLRELLLRLGVTDEKAVELENYLKSTSMTLHNDVTIMLETALSD